MLYTASMKGLAFLATYEKMAYVNVPQIPDSWNDIVSRIY